MTSAIDLDTRVMTRVQYDDASSFGELLHCNRNLVIIVSVPHGGQQGNCRSSRETFSFVSIARIGPTN